ncbi:hypothetical protein BJV82DRAFT_593736 [Fennellomyces sp. T-0311]|nr:hypothetical protein BJV82DRAFT_593736 [Fennellomyces sp. T-0311]
MLDNKTSKPRPLRLKKIFSSPHQRKDSREMAISPPLMGPATSDRSLYSLVSPTRPMFDDCAVLNSVPPRVSTRPSRLPRPITTPPSGGDRRHSFHIPPPASINASQASVRTAPAAPVSHTSSRFAEMATTKKQKRQSRAAAAATMPPPRPLQKSRSTPLRRIKAYNVDYDHHSEMERRRKQKELEELIAGGRRGSTLKLSLTPRGL